MVAAIVVASVIILTQCFSNHENDSGTSIMVEVSATENEFDKIMNRCCEVMEKRIQLFCEDEPGLDKAKFSIKRTNDNKRIRIDFKNVELGQDQVAHVLKLLQSQGCLQFYETYTCVGKAQAIDTLVINQMLIETRDLFPHDLKLAWTVEPEVVDDSEVLSLIALKLSPDNKCALNGEAISDARLEYSSYNGEPEILIMMNNEGAKSWQRITGNNIGRQIAIVFDGYVYFYPVVNSEIPNGRATISGGNLTTEGAINIVNILKAGMLPVPVTVVE